MRSPAARGPAGSEPASARLLALARDTVRCVRGHDLALYAAGVTFYAAVALVPLLLLAVYLATRVAGEEVVRELSRELAARLPQQGAQDAAAWLAEAGTRLTISSAVAAFVPASLYGEGLVRAFDRLSVRGEHGRRTLRGRLGSLAIVGVSPVLLLLGLSTTSALTRALGDGLGPRLLGIYLAFLVGWLSLGLLLALAYRGLAPERPGRRALAWGALGTASMLSGTSLGYLLFLALDIPLDRAYGGSVPIAAVAAGLLWLYLLHVMVLVGYAATLQLAARDGRPLGVVVRAGASRGASVHPAQV